MRFLVILMLALSAICPFSAYASQNSEVLPKDVQRAEMALNNLKQAQADFVMTTSEGNSLGGTFYLNRPGKLRFDFNPPVEDFIVADGRFIYFYDADLGEQSNAPIGTTLADFLLRDDIRLSGDIAVTRVMKAAHLVQITLTQRDDPGTGQLILGFDEESFALKKWRVIDSLGNITEVVLNNMVQNPQFTSDLFYYVDPDKTHGYNE